MVQPNKSSRKFLTEGIYRTNHEFRRDIAEPQAAPRRSSKNTIAENCTQTSKTIIQLAKLEMNDMTPDSLSPKSDNTGKESPKASPKPYVEDIYLPYNRKNYVVDYINSQKLERIPPTRLEEGRSLTEVFLDKHKGDAISQSPSHHRKSLFLQQSSPLKKAMNSPIFKSQSFAEDLTYPVPAKEKKVRSTRFTIRNIKDNVPLTTIAAPPMFFCAATSSLKLPEDEEVMKSVEEVQREHSSFMSPTISSENKNILPKIQNTQNAFDKLRRGNSFSPQKEMNKHEKDVKSVSCRENIHDDQFCEHHSYPLNDVDSDTNCFTDVNAFSTKDAAFTQAINKLRVSDWNISLRGLLDIVELCKNKEKDIYPHMTSINQRLIELLRSPRSHVCRTACQAAGHLFEYIKDTRRPEFDEIVDNLLCRTADSNKFIRQDANLALDCMVTYIPPLHSVRAMCMKGPYHKNHLVRLAVARLLVCVVVISGSDKIVGSSSTDGTRKRIFISMARFLNDINLETRKMGERLYKLLSKEHMFEILLKKHLEKEDITLLKKNLKTVGRLN
ncbi:unnamed protein product [Brassicogethes aeneus]|uniref:TOG domain-containing protein n=1 Tax=Brassicogethes aeneus TaxID=1431903 RepID=A0A9P0FJK8_BRAAE|nr:unnamed protein product [Brassicogethes aeneus]